MVSLLVGEEGEACLTLSGRISLHNMREVMGQAMPLFDRTPLKKLAIDLADLDRVDSAGALFLLLLEREAQRRSLPFEFLHMSSKVRRVMGLLDRRVLFARPPEGNDGSLGFLEEVGETSFGFFDDIVQSITFGGTLISEVILSLLRPSTVRWRDVLACMKKVGVDAVPILGLISFLMGLIIAFMSSLQLKQFGANIYVASLVAIAMVRELGPIITAILVAGRSGSAFAAEIGTMKVNEEVDALVTMGFNPVRFLAVPKVYAAVLVVPFLTLFSDLFAIVGGMCVGILGLNLTFYTYTQQTSWALTIFDVVAAEVKSVAFAILIVWIGCQRGFGVRGGAQAVGNATTSAVVSGLFLIIVADSTFALVLNYIRW